MLTTPSDTLRYNKTEQKNVLLKRSHVNACKMMLYCSSLPVSYICSYPRITERNPPSTPFYCYSYNGKLLRPVCAFRYIYTAGALHMSPRTICPSKITEGLLITSDNRA